MAETEKKPEVKKGKWAKNLETLVVVYTNGNLTFAADLKLITDQKIKDQLALHGLQQKLGDEMAGMTEKAGYKDADRKQAMSEVFDNLVAGKWASPREAREAGIAVSKVAEPFVNMFIQATDKKTRDLILSSIAVMPKAEEIKKAFDELLEEKRKETQKK